MGENKSTIEKICSLYQNDKRSIAMIAEEFGISSNKVVYWLKKNNIPRRDRSQAGYLAHSQRFKKFSCKIKGNLTPKEKELLVTGVMLYWAEGSKRNNTYIAFSNSDPKMIQLFLKFLRKICGIYEYRLRILLHFYEDQNEKQLKKYWSKITNIPLTQFQSSYTHKGKIGTYKKKSKYGTISLRYCDKKLFDQILERIDKYVNKFS